MNWVILALIIGVSNSGVSVKNEQCFLEEV